MKAFIAFCCAILVAGLSFAVVPPPCTTFDDQQLDGWTFQNGSGTAQPGHGGYYADVHDAQGGSGFLSPPSYHGDWLKIVNNCGEICFDVNILDDGWASTSNPVSVSFSIKDSNGHYANFVHTPVVEGSGWHTFCAPIGPLVGGNLPNNGQGTWQWGSGNNSNWTGLLQNVIEFRFSIDFASSPSQSEHFQIDNICFKANTCAKADFNVKTICAGQAATFVDASTAASSWLWSFNGGSPASSNAQAPGPITYANAGSYPVKLCINGGSNAPLCITKTLIVNAAPAIPAISGPTTTCQNPATYCVTNPQSGVVYNWSATNGTVNPATGTCTSVHWNTTAGGIIVVTATNKAGCTSIRRFEVTGCKPNPCCDKPSFKVDSWTMPFTGGHYVFTPKLTSTVPVKRVVIDILSASITYSSTACGTAHAFVPAITSVNPVTSFTASQPVLNGTEAVWNVNGLPAALNATPFPIDVALPAHSGACDDTVHFCVKYTVTDAECRTCEIIECYDYTRKAAIDPNPDDHNPN